MRATHNNIKGAPAAGSRVATRGSLAAVLVIAGLLVWQGADVQPVDANRPLKLVGTITDDSPAETLRVGSFNIHGGKGRDGRCELDRTAACLAGLDVVGIYEVHAHIGNSQAAQLGERLRMASLFAPTERKWWKDDRGNGILTRRPLRAWRRIPLPSAQDKKFPNVILTSVEHDGRIVKIVATHIDRRLDRERQLQQVIDLFLSLEAPAILMGDLNTTTSDPQIKQLLSAPGVEDVLSSVEFIEASRPRVDWIITRGLRTVSKSCEVTDASDHPVVWGEFVIDPAQAPVSGVRRTGMSAN